MSSIPRLRMFAGPNGSGKSTIKSVWLAEVTEGCILTMKTSQMPAWFKTAVWDKFAEWQGESN